MDSVVKKKVAGKPIEKLLKNNTLVPIDANALVESLNRLHHLRETYMLAPKSNRFVFKLPSLKK